MAFDLAEDFFHSIVIPVDLMTFQKGHSECFEKLAVVPLGDAVCLHRLVPA